MKYHVAFLGSLIAAASPTLFAESLNCAALANSTEAEPAGYAAACGIVQPKATNAATSSTPAPAPVANAYSPNVPTDTAFVLNIRTGQPTTGFNRHVLNNMPGMTTISTPGLNVFAMDFDQTAQILYISDSTATAPVNPILKTINVATGAVTTIAPITGLAPEGSPAVAVNPSGLNIEPATGVAYLSTGANLYTINLTTAVATLVGPFNSGGLMIDISSNCAGAMYGHDITSDALFSINKTTGAATLVGPHGLAANFAQGMDFDNNTGTLYAYIYTGGGTYTYGTFNLATGAITPLNTNTPPGEWEAATRTLCTLPVSLQSFSVD